jgi:hypothetical protein
MQGRGCCCAGFLCYYVIVTSSLRYKPGFHASLYTHGCLCCRVDVHIKPSQAGVDTSKSYWINVGR